MTTFFILLACAVLALNLYIRFSPNSSEDWHLEPSEVDHPGRKGVRLIGRDAPRFPGDADLVLQTFADIAAEEPNMHLLDGSLDEGMMTFVKRTPFWGFPDLVTVMAVDEGREAKLSIVSRSRFGSYDFGKNAERVDRWLQEMRLRLDS